MRGHVCDFGKQNSLPWERLDHRQYSFFDTCASTSTPASFVITMATPQEPLLERSNTESSSLYSQTPMSDMDTQFSEKDIQELQQQQQQPDPAVEAVRKFLPDIGHASIPSCLTNVVMD